MGIAKLFMTGQSQAVRLPKEFRFEGTEVEIRRDEITGEVVLRPRRHSWADFYALADHTDIPADFLDEKDRLRNDPIIDPFAGYEE
jgi:antitoxin VapB